MCNDPARPGGRLIRRLAAALRDRRGVSAIEFGAVVPVIALILTATYDLGNLVQMRMKLSEAAYAGGQYAVAFPSNASGISAAITAALPAGWSDVTITGPTTVCTCWTAGGGEAAASCASDPVCPTGQVLQRTITLSLTKPYSPLMMVSLTSISASYVTRVQ